MQQFFKLNNTSILCWIMFILPCGFLQFAFNTLNISNYNTGQQHLYKLHTPSSNNDSGLASTNGPMQLITLLDYKYNFTKRINPIYSKTASHYVKLHQKYVSCFRYIKIKSHCQLPNNISILIHNNLGFGYTSNVYNVTIYTQNTSNNDYVLKIYHRPAYFSRNEPNLFTKLHRYVEYYNLSYHALSLSAIHPTIPTYQIKKRVLIFYKQIKNAVTWNETMVQAESMLPYIIPAKGSIMNFLVDCFDDIMDVFQIFYDMGVYYIDFHWANLLINAKTFKCYIIDYGTILDEKYLLKRQPKTVPLDNRPVRSCLFLPSYHAVTCPPVVYHYLSTLAKRRMFRDELLNITHHISRKKNRRVRPRAGKALSKLMIYSKQYEIAVTVFHAFIRFYFLKIQEKNNDIYTLNEALIQPLSDTENRVNVILLWCNRYGLYRKIIKILHNGYDWVSSDVKRRFMDIISVIDDDLLFLNSSNCHFIRDSRILTG